MISLSEFLTESLNDRIVPLKYNSFMQYNINRERISMPQIPQERVDDFLIHFSDKYRVQKCTMDIGSIKPSQKEMDDNKVIGMYKDRSFKPTDNIFVISKDNYLVDGHHRWAAGLEEDDTQKVNVYKINLPIKKLLWILNKMKITNARKVFIPCLCPFCQYTDATRTAVRSHIMTAHTDEEYERDYGE